MRIRAILAATIFSLGFNVAFGTSEHSQIAPLGESTLSTVVGNRKISVQFHTFVAKKSDPWFPSEFEGYNELSFIQRLGITVDGETLWVPRSAYTDLFNPRAAAVRLEQGLFVLSIVGADGADAYQVRIYFDSKKVIRRAFYGLEGSTKKPSEETRYAPPQIIN
jgi:hypothetical protein